MVSAELKVEPWNQMVLVKALNDVVVCGRRFRAYPAEWKAPRYVKQPPKPLVYMRYPMQMEALPERRRCQGQETMDLLRFLENATGEQVQLKYQEHFMSVRKQWWILARVCFGEEQLLRDAWCQEWRTEDDVPDWAVAVERWAVPGWVRKPAPSVCLPVWSEGFKRFE